MDINELQRLMQETGACIRAIPLRQRDIVEVRHKKDYPNGRVIFLPEFKREMVVDESVPEDAGKFLIEVHCGTNSMVRFLGKKWYDTLEEAAETLARLSENPSITNSEADAPAYPWIDRDW